MLGALLHAVVARSTFPSKKWQSTSFSDDFWKLRCGKSARRCGAKHMWKWKCTKCTILGPLWKVEMLKKCTLLWRGAHLKVKSGKARHSRTTFWRFDCHSMSKKCTPLWREAHLEVKSVKARHSRSTLGSWDVEKVHALVARSTFVSEQVQSTSGPEHSWQLRCRKVCGVAAWSTCGSENA